jgi:aminoglycoside phosphotransferase (APT) family kinase protein
MPGDQRPAAGADAPADATGVPGMDVAALRRWLAEHGHLVLGDDVSVTLFATGLSNLTYLVRDDASSLIVRRPPLGHVLPTAHDMAREHRVIAALAGTPVPVPRVHALCLDDSVIGAPFYVMDYVEGALYRTKSSLEALGEQRVRCVSERVVDTLAALHDVDPVAVGLEDFGRPEGFLARQVARWKKQMDASTTEPLAGEAQLQSLLAASVPSSSKVAVLHGDFRLDNLLFHASHANADEADADNDEADAADDVAAVLDWEMATLGDPLTDLGLLLTYQRLAVQVEGTSAFPDASTAAGHLSVDEEVERYVAARGVDVDRLGFYVGLSSYKLAAILQGIHYRYLLGQTVGPGFEGVGGLVEPILESGLSAMKEYR